MRAILNIYSTTTRFSSDPCFVLCCRCCCCCCLLLLLLLYKCKLRPGTQANTCSCLWWAVLKLKLFKANLFVNAIIYNILLIVVRFFRYIVLFFVFFFVANEFTKAYSAVLTWGVIIKLSILVNLEP